MNRKPQIHLKPQIDTWKGPDTDRPGTVSDCTRQKLLVLLKTALSSPAPLPGRARARAHTYFTAIKKTEIWTFATTWMDPASTILSEINQTKKNTI